MLAALTITFDPILQVGDSASVRLETIALAIVLFVGLALAVRISSITPAGGSALPGQGLRMDDLVFIVVGAVPGAIAGGRLGYVLDHIDYYGANPSAVLDPAQGGLTLTLAVPLGILTAAPIARLLGASVARWMHAAALPLLFVLAAGKLVGILGASGQGAPTDLSWATAYGGPGPWGSLAADVPSHPAQVYEAIAVGLAVVILYLGTRIGWLRPRDGATLYAALGLWAVARFVVAFSWRDPTVIGPLRMEQLESLLIAAIAVVGLLERARARRRSGREAGADSGPQPA